MRSPGRRRVAVAIAIAVTMGLASCGSTGATGRTAIPAGSLRWAACDGTDGPSGTSCASLVVPATPGATSGPTVALALDRIRATGTRIGSLVVNPGGPGVSAVDELPDLYSVLSPAVRAHFDVVGYDPPGVGHSEAVSCLTGPAYTAYLSSDPSPPGPPGFASVVATARRFVAACEASPSGPLLAHVSTADAAADLDLVRAALGDPRLSYLGFSYGTLLGATYAAAHPDRVRALVLDGAIDPTLSPLAELEGQGAAVDAELGRFAAACRADPSCPWHPGPDAAASFGGLLEQARAGRVKGAGPAQVLYGTAEALYATASWPQLESALAAAGKGDGSGLGRLFDQYVEVGSDGRPSTVTESETAVNCLDVTAPGLPEVQAASAAAASAGSIFTPLDVDAEATCSVWPVPSSAGPPHAVTAVGAPPILVVGSTGDPITPYGWAVHLASQLGSGVLLTRVGDGHTAYAASSCVRAAVDSYLVDLRPPAAGTRCPSG